MYSYCIHSDSNQVTDLLNHFFPPSQPDTDLMQGLYLILFYQFYPDFFPLPHHIAYNKF